MCQVFRTIQHIGKHISCHLPGGCVVVGHFWKPYKGQVLSGKLDLIVMICRAEEHAAIQREKSLGFREQE